MGFLFTLLLSIVFGALAIFRPKIAVYLLLALFVFFDEMGPGFTTYRGSFVFNAFFVGFYGLRLFEVLTLAIYIPVILLPARASPSRRTPSTDPDQIEVTGAFSTEKWLCFALFGWILFLVAVEYAIAGKASWGDWRLLVTGCMQFHLLVITFRTRSEVLRFVYVLIVMLSLKAAYGLLMFAAGQGTMTPRGRLPFFWDSRQVEAFGLGAVLLLAFIINHKVISASQRMIPLALAWLMWFVLIAAVAGSIRRTIWLATSTGLVAILLLSKRTGFIHVFWIVLGGSIAAVAIAFAPGLDGVRSKMDKYVSSMNLFDESQRGRVENDVHINNVEQYGKMLMENTDIMILGIHGPSGVHYKEILLGQYSEGGYRLGMAHNGVLRTMLFFGFPALIVYFAFYFSILARTIRIYRHLPESDCLKHFAIGCSLIPLLDFLSAMLFVPPFFTISKAIFYTFLQAFVVGVVAHGARESSRPPSVSPRGRGRIAAGVAARA